MSTTLPLEVEFDHELGGRWASLRAGGREWLWSNPDPATREARAAVGPDSPFVDAGGGEECFPSLRAPFDHGLVWNRPWRPDDGGAAVAADGYTLRRQAERQGDDLLVHYQASSGEALRMMHATHLLLELSDRAGLLPANLGEVRFFDPAPSEEIERLGGLGAFVRTLGTGEPGAVCFGLVDCRAVTITDGADQLSIAVEPATAGLPVAFIVWRNLFGWPDEGPYRSIGIEPAIGHGVSLPGERPTDTVALQPGEEIRWTLRLRASRG